MEGANNQSNTSVPAAAPASAAADEAAVPLKLQLEVTLPAALGGELWAWRRAFERFADVMERWLESAGSHPGLPPPPPMPWTAAPVREPQPAPPASCSPPTNRQDTGLPTDKIPAPPTREMPAPTLPPLPPQETLPFSLTEKTALPEEMPPLLVEDSLPVPAVAPRCDTQAKKAAPSTQTVEARPVPTQIEIVETAAVEDNAAVEQAALKAQLGERYRAAGDKEKALVCYREALDLDPDCTLAYLGRASIYIEQGRFNEALLDCNSALRREPERAVLYVLRGLVYARLGDLKRALVEAEDAIRFDPRSPSAYMLRGTVRFKKGMTGEALDDVKTAIRLRPSDAKFHAEMARMLVQTGQYEQAARIYARVLELSPNFHEARLQRGAALRQAGEPTEAEAELTEYLRRRPGNAAAHYQRGLCRLAQHNYAQAIADFDKTLTLNPNDKAAAHAKKKALQQWEDTSRRSRSARVPAAMVAFAATSSVAPSAAPTRSEPILSKPAPVKTSPAKTKPSRSVRRRWRDDGDELNRWFGPAKWACGLVLIGLLSFGGFRLLASAVSNPYKPDVIPPASAKLSAEELVQRYKSNPTAAQAELSDRLIEVTGMVARHFDDKTPPVVVLAVTGSKTTVTCTLRVEPSLYQQMLLSRIQPDSKATIVGACAGSQENTIALKECLLVKIVRSSGQARR
jgi:tetratricopeptide (TPR) repeat protein